MSGPSLNIFFYSKYVPGCLSLMRDLDLEKIFVFCVDNASVRSKIMSDSKWNIRSVPLLLQIYEDGSSKIFTDDDDIRQLCSFQEPEDPSEKEEDIIRDDEEEEEMDTLKDVSESDNTKSNNTSISNIVQKMQRERENDDHVLKIAMKPE